MHRVYDLDPDFSIEVLPAAPPLPAEIEARIGAIWDREQRRLGPALYNGTVYSLAAHTKKRLTVRQADYRQLIALRRAPELAASLALRPVGVTGILTCRDGVVLGQRGPQVAADPGMWEPAPSGSLDRLDPAGQVLDELKDELGVAMDAVKPLRALGLIEDLDSRIVDILFRLECDLTEGDLRALHRKSGSDEYQAIAVASPRALPDFLASHRSQALPVLEAMLRLGGVLRA